ncbi:MAG: hypothetical protein IJ784_06300 [Ruminiclostridium sp.]|nr:hypothetical protein [Ruminiclostridium sp.]
MEQKLQELQALGLDTDTGIMFTGSPEKYIPAIARYVRSCEDNISGIREHLASGDMQRYTIAVHAVKSNSKMIGHTELFKAFESLEAAGKRDDLAFIGENNDRILERYAEAAEQLKPFAEGPAEAAAPAIALAEAGETAEKLLEALDDFDDELSAELVTRLSGYPFGDGDREKLAETKKLISDFMYDEAADLIRELQGRLQ